MPLDEDKYPAESGRRRFVKGVVGSAALSSVGAGGAAALDATTGPLGAGGGRTNFFGIENTAGPAPRGMPIIPIEITDAGELRGQTPQTVEEIDEGGGGFNGSGVPYTWSWFQYCGIQSYAGLNPEADEDNFFRATPGTYDWMSDVEGGEPLTVDMFDDYESWNNDIGSAGVGKPATASWRSEGPDAQTIPVQVLRSKRVTQMVNGEGPYSDLDESVRTFLEGATSQDFMVWLNKCTHFCCVPGFKAYGDSARFDAENRVYCQCHQSVYDPFSPVQKDFVALPRPDE
ncbi:ubiquinol-cytochrome c reductase iron-sulfur subunit [Halobacteria archaeon HArc-gm2]|nr:ubiquinol-cytochrome c reductase iron-sulfur subunit [Halobacteria archaeon HArc-gm2]